MKTLNICLQWKPLFKHLPSGLRIAKPKMPLHWLAPAGSTVSRLVLSQLCSAEHKEKRLLERDGFIKENTAAPQAKGKCFQWLEIIQMGAQQRNPCLSFQGKWQSVFTPDIKGQPVPSGIASNTSLMVDRSIDQGRRKKKAWSIGTAAKNCESN